MSLLSWGNYPKTKGRTFRFDKISTLKQIINEYDELIAYGHGRSYGDSALSENIIKLRPYKYFLKFKICYFNFNMKLLNNLILLLT